MSTSPRRRRSLLFAPGMRPDRFAKALASGADSVCLDLEDGVAPQSKDRAREEVVTFLANRSDSSGSEPEVVVRINPPDSARGRGDLQALATLDPERAPAAIMIPKPESAAALESVSRALSPACPALLPLVETPAGLVNVHEIAACTRGTGALLFGGMDLAAELGADFAWEALLYARSRLVLAAAAAGVDALDVPYPTLDDKQGLEDEARRASRLGFAGKMAIHPAQVPILNRAFAPLADEAARAQRIVDAAAVAEEGVFVVDGQMVDRPIVEAARRTLARAGAMSDEIHRR